MPSALQAIAAADESARRDLEELITRLAARLQAAREQIEAERSAAEADARADLAASVRAIEEEGDRRLEERRRSRDDARVQRRQRADAILPAAVAAFLAVIRGEPPDRGGGR